MITLGNCFSLLSYEHGEIKGQTRIYTAWDENECHVD